MLDQYDIEMSAKESIVEVKKSSYSTDTSFSVIAASLDVESIMQTSEVITSTIDMNKLITNITNIITKSAGANMGAVIIDHQVHAQKIGNTVPQSTKIPLEHWKSGCKSMVEYVIRTRETIVVGSALHDRRYAFIAADPYVIEKKCRSMLCMPVIRNDQLRAILYLENDSIIDCFDKQRVTLLFILASNIAISLENSQYFETHLRAAEQLAHVQSSRARESEKYRKIQEEFIDRICHEIRNPLQGILGNIAVIRSSINDFPDPIKTNLDNSVNAIEICAQYQKSIAEDVLTLSRLEHGKYVTDSQPFVLSELLYGIISIFKVVMSNKQINFVQRFSITHDLVVHSDQALLSQLLANILSNAIKFTSKKGTIVMSCDCEQVDDHVMQVTLKISDTGCGMSREQTSRIFDRFEQSTQRTFSEYGGSGLGLFICKQIVDNLNGNIQVQSAVHVGTQFTITLPCGIHVSTTPTTPKTFKKNHFSLLSPEAPPSHMEPAAPSVNALVVEDNKINQKVLTRMLEKSGCTCVIANNGLEGLNAYCESQFDIVFMDVAMPVMDGFECCKKIRDFEASRNKPQVPIVCVSGNVRQEYQDLGLEAGMSMYLCKPISLNQISQVLSTYIK
ncbi:sensor kinase/phosphatase LuxQ [Acrasis kona]|uniref:histidine kinase n=1 Tax=Acrasis kona TaxID=1008807 RepID=A0AAW2YWT3_9EUKA